MIVYELKEISTLFITNPKAGVTITNSLIQALDIKFKRKDIIHQKIDLDSYKRAIFIFRDPYQRTVSMFLRFCNTLKSNEHHKKEESEELNRLMGNPQAGLTFNVFLDYLNSTDDHERNIHYRTQRIPTRYTHLIRTHNYKDDLYKIFQDDRRSASLMGADKIDFSSLESNPASANRLPYSEDFSNMPSRILANEYKKAYPTAESFINKKNLPIIEAVFSEEIEFALRNTALQRAYS